LQAAAYYATAAALGVMGGWTFALIWTRLAPMSVQGQFWSTLSGVARSILVAEHSHEFLDLYRRLGIALFRYLARNVGGLILGSLPLIALAGALSASVFEPWPDHAGWNPFFPYLNDLEFMFFGMATVGVVGAMLIRRRRT
jgi:hypothetical protein